MRTYTQTELMGATPVFCVEFTYAGKIHRYASDFVAIKSNTGKHFDFLPTIRDFDFIDSADVLSVDVEANIVSMGLVLVDVDVLQCIAQGLNLDGIDAEFFYVLTKNSECITIYEHRVILYRGQIQEPVYGDPADLDNFIAFSIECQPYTSERLLLDTDLVMTKEAFHDIDTDGALGKPYPIVLGYPSTSDNIYTCPAYCVHIYDSHDDCRMMIAGHRITANFATIQDDNYQTATKAILTDTDDIGRVYSYIYLRTSDNVAMPGYSGSGDSREWWVYLDDGGMLNPYGEGALTGGGDICRWALQRSGQRVDDGQWANLSAILNAYTFSGYINDEKITAYEWLQGNIIPYLPISMQMGSNGIRPVITELWALTHVTAVTSIEVGIDKECQQSTAVQTLRSTSDLANTISLKYAKKGHDQSPSLTCTVSSNLALQSQNKYGIRTQILEADYIYDVGTATKVVEDKISALSAPLLSVEIDAPVYLGYLQVGDVCSVSIPRLHIKNKKMMIVKKQWAGLNWSYGLLFQ